MQKRLRNSGKKFGEKEEWNQGAKWFIKFQKGLNGKEKQARITITKEQDDEGFEENVKLEISWTRQYSRNFIKEFYKNVW